MAPKLDRSRSKLTRGNTLRSKLGYGWGLGLGRREKDKEELYTEVDRSSSATTILPVYPRDAPPPSCQRLPRLRPESKDSQASRATKSSNLSNGSKQSNNSQRPSLTGSGSLNTLVGSALERKEAYQDPIREIVDTYPRMTELRKLMAKDNLDYYVVPSEDAHQSEYTAEADKRREWISNFTGSAGQAIISKSAAYLVTDSRYWLQAEKELDENWVLIRSGMPSGPRNWVDWITDRANESRVGIDARMVSNETATQLYPLLQAKKSKLVYPSQNLIDLIWEGKPTRSKNKIYVQPIEYTGKDASKKLTQVRDWIKNHPPSGTSPSRNPPPPSQQHVGTLVTNLASIAYVLNLRGDDIPFNPVFVSYLYIGLDRVILFIEQEKVEPPVREYLQNLKVEIRDYNGIWSFLRTREWGEGKVIISPQTSYAISLMLTHYRYTVAPSVIEEMKSVKNEVEIQGLKRAYLRDGACYVQFLAWLDEKMSKGFQISEWEAAWRLTEFRSKAKNYMGLAYENISATGPNAALPHYTPLKSDSLFIDKETPYLNDSGGQYRDGTCDTTRTMHFGRPTLDQSGAYTRVLQGHIAIDTAIFPKGTTGAQLDVLARKNLWQDGLNYLHGTGHGVGSFLNVHEGLHGFSSDVPLTRGHVLTNEPGYYRANDFGIRIESVLVVRDVRTKHIDPDQTWLGFERLTCVPIQTRMVLDHMLSKEEKDWIREHNRACLNALEGLLRDDKRALKWLRREAERSIGIAPAGPGGVIIDWD
ncbi:Creatinase/aminopeptidase [Multifurca ochricompacta]|uniref:Creatinase/aminopeptidase n=1 Tax=Multifurca ochricompacta TaxID=376703 RepID=A0AAD4QQT1_9AGAM|nr:Creatinase/aminopeptidase [Multifurca ochricompacta]